MSKIWDRPSCLAKIPLMIDKDCNIISGGSHFTEFLGSLARNGIYCPLVKESWSEVESKYKDGILEVINVSSKCLLQPLIAVMLYFNYFLRIHFT